MSIDRFEKPMDVLYNWYMGIKDLVKPLELPFLPKEGYTTIWISKQMKADLDKLKPPKVTYTQLIGYLLDCKRKLDGRTD